MSPPSTDLTETAARPGSTHRQSHAGQSHAGVGGGPHVVLRVDDVSVDGVSIDDALRERTLGDLCREGVQAARLGVYDFDLVTGAAAWSDRALEIYGGFDEPPTVVQLRARVHPLDWPKLYAARQDADSHAAAVQQTPDQAPAPLPTDLTHRIILPNGQLRWVRATGEYRFGPDGTLLRSVGVLRDVTDETASQHEVAADADHGRRALAAADLGTFDYNARTDVVRWDARTKVIFGLPADAPDDRPLAATVEYFHPDDRANVHAAISRALDPHVGGRFEAKHRIVRPDGTVRHVAGRAVVEFAKGFGNRYAVRTVGTIEDVTDRPARTPSS